MSHRHTTEIAFLKAENDRLRTTILQQHFVLESNASIAAAFAFDLVMWLSSRWWTRWLVAPVMKRMENAGDRARATA